MARKQQLYRPNMLIQVWPASFAIFSSALQSCFIHLPFRTWLYSMPCTRTHLSRQSHSSSLHMWPLLPLSGNGYLGSCSVSDLPSLLCFYKALTWLLAMLGSLPLLCYMAHGQWKGWAMGSGYYGFGMLDITLDWNYAGFFLPLVSTTRILPRRKLAFLYAFS